LLFRHLLIQDFGMRTIYDKVPIYKPVQRITGSKDD
jgi:hypothetical protein